MERDYSESMGTRGDVKGKLQDIYGEGAGGAQEPPCWIFIPKSGGNPQAPEDVRYAFKAVPDISDSKSANYNSQTIFGRSSPIRSYSDSSARTISVTFDMYNVDPEARKENFQFVRALAVAVHPSYDEESMYDPPPICKFKCGTLLSGANENDRNVNAIQCLIMNYNFSYGRESMFDDGMMPFHISGTLDLEVVHSQDTLPGREQVIKGQF